MTTAAVTEQLTNEQVEMASNIMRRIVSGNLGDAEWKILHGRGGSLLAMSALWRSVADESHVYRFQVQGVTKECVSISPCPGKKWIWASQFVYQMHLARRVLSVPDLYAVVAAHPYLGLEHKLLAIGNPTLPGELCEFDQVRGREIVRVSHKGLPEYYRYLALRA